MPEENQEQHFTDDALIQLVDDAILTNNWEKVNGLGSSEFDVTIKKENLVKICFLTQSKAMEEATKEAIREKFKSADKKISRPVRYRVTLDKDKIKALMEITTAMESNNVEEFNEKSKDPFLNVNYKDAYAPIFLSKAAELKMQGGVDSKILKAVEDEFNAYISNYLYASAHKLITDAILSGEMEEVYHKLEKICEGGSYEAYRVDKDSITNLWSISNSIRDNNEKRFKYLLELDRGLGVVDSYKVPLLKRVISDRPDFLVPLLESSLQVADYYYRNMDDLQKYDTSGSLASDPNKMTPIGRLIKAIEADDRKEVAMILSDFHNSYNLTTYNQTASYLKNKGSIDYLRELATEKKRYKVLPYLLDYDKYISHGRYGIGGQTENIPIPDSADEISSCLYKAENLEREAQRYYPNDKEIPEYMCKGRKEIVDNKLEEIKAVLAKEKKDVTKKDVKKFFSLLEDAGCHVLDNLVGAEKFVQDHALALLKLSVSHRRYTLLDPLMQIEGVRQVAFNNITKICNKVPWFNGKLKPGLKDLMNDLTKELKPAIKTNTYNPLSRVKLFKALKGVKNRLSAIKFSLGSRPRAAATRRGVSVKRSKKSAPPSPPENHGPGNS